MDRPKFEVKKSFIRPYISPELYAAWEESAFCMSDLSREDGAYRRIEVKIDQYTRKVVKTIVEGLKVYNPHNIRHYNTVLQKIRHDVEMQYWARQKAAAAPPAEAAQNS